MQRLHHAAYSPVVLVCLAPTCGTHAYLRKGLALWTGAIDVDFKCKRMAMNAQQRMQTSGKGITHLTASQGLSGQEFSGWCRAILLWRLHWGLLRAAECSSPVVVSLGCLQSPLAAAWPASPTFALIFRDWSYAIRYHRSLGQNYRVLVCGVMMSNRCQ